MLSATTAVQSYLSGLLEPKPAPAPPVPAAAAAAPAAATAVSCQAPAPAASKPAATVQRVRGVESSRWVSFRLGAQAYGVEVLRVQEVLRVPELTPVPRAPGFVLGVINLRGAIVTVVDAHALLQSAPQDVTEDSRVIVADFAGQAIGLLVDGVADVLQLRPQDIGPAPRVAEDTGEEVCGVVERAGQLVILLSVERLLAGCEGLSG